MKSEIHIIALILLSLHFSVGQLVHKFDEVRVEELQVQMRLANGTGKSLGTLRIPTDKKMSKLIRLDSALVAHLSFKVVNVKNGTPIEGFQQVFLRLFHSKTAEHELYFVGRASRSEKGKYSMEINISRDPLRFKGRPGKYHCELLFGDQRLKIGFRWEPFDVFIDIPKPRQMPPASYQPQNRLPKYEAQPEIAHLSTPLEKCNFKMWPLFNIFAVLCALPLLLLLYLWLPLLLPCLSSLLSSVHSPFGQLFLQSICSIFCLYTFAWINAWNLGFCLRMLPLFCIPCFFLGHKALCSVATERIQNEPEPEFEDEMEEEESERNEEKRNSATEDEQEEYLNLEKEHGLNGSFNWAREDFPDNLISE